MDASSKTIERSSSNLKSEESKHDVLLQNSDHQRHSKSHSRSRGSEGDGRVSSTSKRTSAQMSQKTHDENPAAKRSNGKVYRRSSYKIANKPSSSRNSSSSKRISLEGSTASSSRGLADAKSSKHYKTSQERMRLLSHAKGKRHARERESSMGSKTVTPKATDPPSSSSPHLKKFPESLGQPVREGQLKSKNTFVDGKYSVDRAWKSTYAVLRGNCLCLHPDKNSQNLVVYDHPIFIGSALVDIAYDYTKRSNVFRVTTLNFSEFLFEAATSEVMLEWIRTLQKQGLAYSQDFLKKNLLSTSLRLEKASRSHAKVHNKKQALSLDSPTSATKQSNSTHKHDFLQPSNFLLRFRSKSPEGRRLKSEGTSPGTHHESKLKTWREKVAERFKRANSHPGTTLQSPNNPGPQLSPPQHDKGSGLSSSNGEEQSEGAVGCLGVPLDRCVASPNNEHLPLIVETCIGVIESQGLNNRGIYRVPGNSAAISTLQSQVEKDPMTLNRDHEKWNDTNAVVSLLKLFFRKLPEPLVTKELYQSFIEANHSEDKRKRLLDIKRLIHLLPARNFETFKSLANHLNKVSTFEKTNMMDARNLAIVFGPTLLQPAGDKNVLNMVKDMNDQCQIVESIIAHYKWFFGSWDDDIQFPGVDGSKAEPITTMESQLIEKAQHLEMSSNSSKKGRFTSLVNQPPSTKLPKKETENAPRGMTVFSVESVYCDMENSPDPFDVQRTSRSKNHDRSSSKVKGEVLYERTGNEGRSNQSERQDRISRKKFKEDVYKSTFSVSEERTPRSQKQFRTFDSVDCNNSRDEIDPTCVDPNSSTKMEIVSRDVSRRASYNEVIKPLDDQVLSNEASPDQSGDFSGDDPVKKDRIKADRDSSQPVRRLNKKQNPTTDRIVKNIPNSSLLQPPKMQFRSRSSQKHSKKMSFKPLRSESRMTSEEVLTSGGKDGPDKMSTNSLERINKYIVRDQQLFAPVKSSSNRKTSNLKTFHLAVSSLEHAPSDTMVKDSIHKRHDSFHHLNLGSDDDDATTKASTTDFESTLDQKDSVSDNVFFERDVAPRSARKRSVSAENLLHVTGLPKVGSLFGRDENLLQSQPPIVNQSKLSKLFLSLHSLKSPNKSKKSFQYERINSPTTSSLDREKANLHVIGNLSNDIQRDLKTSKEEDTERHSTGQRNAIKRLVRTWSTGNCFAKEGLSSPSCVKDGSRASVSYESSV